MKYLFPFIVLLSPSIGLTAEYDEWTYASKNTNDAIIYVRTEDALKGRPDQTQARAWLKTDYSKDATVSVRERKSLLEINCPAQTYRIITITSYYPNGKSESETPSYPKTSYVVPGSAIEPVIKMVCSEGPE